MKTTNTIIIIGAIIYLIAFFFWVRYHLGKAHEIDKEGNPVDGQGKN